MKKVIVGLMSAALVLTFGCGKAAKKLSESAVERAIEAQTAGKADVDIKDGKVTVKTKDGSSVYDASGHASIPADFPKDIYVPKGAKIMNSVTTPDGMMMMMEVAEAMARIGETYSAEMKSQGWKEEASTKMEGQLVISFKKDNRTTAFMVSGEGAKSQVILTVAKEAKPSE